MPLRRLLFLLATWALLALVARQLVGELERLASPGVLVPVLFLPWLAVVVAHGPREAFGALRDAFDRRVEDLPRARRELSATVLRSVGSASLAGGLLGLFLGVVHTLNLIAASPGQAHPTELLVGIGASFVAPFYGLALRAFLYEPLAEGLDPTPAEDGEPAE